MNPFRSRDMTGLRPLFLLLALVSVMGVFAQNGFTIYGKLRVDGGSVDGCRVVVYRNGVKVRTVTDDMRKFSMPLDLNQNYILSFEKDGFVTKKLSFDTHAPATAVQNGLLPFDFVVSLFKQYDGVNTVVFNQPVGVIRYSAELRDFDYDTDYTKSIQSALKDVEDAVAKKKAEEHDSGGKADKVSAEADRQQAQQAADAEKAAQAKAKQDADVAKQLADAKAKQDSDAAKQLADAKAKQDTDAKLAADAKTKADADVAKQFAAANAKADAQAVAQAKAQKDAENAAAKAKAKAEWDAAARKKQETQVAVRPIPTQPPAQSRPVPVKREPRPTMSAQAKQGAEQRNVAIPGNGVETSHVEAANVHVVNDPRPKYQASSDTPVRHQQLIVEPNQVVMIVRVEDPQRSVEYKKVVRKYGGTFYFKDGISCTKLTYDSEALADTGW